MRVVQIAKEGERRVAIVDEPSLVCLQGADDSLYAIARECLQHQQSLGARLLERATGESLSYDAIYSGASPWRLLSPIDVPGVPERMLVSGTGLTHLGSARDRQSMHLQTARDPATPITDSMRMFESGLENGRPAEGLIGIAPEWFYKGDGTVLQPPNAPLRLPAYGEDGGEEAEIAGVYLIGEDGVPARVGMAAGNEFSDHLFERRNYLNLAGSKLRACSIGPELLVDADFTSVSGQTRIERDGKVVWSKAIESGEENMAHSLANLEHHHFKFEGHRTPGHLHVHFFGAHSLSFGEGFRLEDGDTMVVRFDGYGRALRNPLQVAPAKDNLPVRVTTLR